MSSGLHSTPDHSLLGLKARRLGVVTADEAVVFMREDCHVCRAEGLGSRARVLLTAGDRSVVATLYQVTSGLLGQGEAAKDTNRGRIDRILAARARRRVPS